MRDPSTRTAYKYTSNALSNGQFIKIANRLLTSIMAPFNFPLVKRNDENSYLVVTEIVYIYRTDMAIQCLTSSISGGFVREREKKYL